MADAAISEGANIEMSDIWSVENSAGIEIDRVHGLDIAGAKFNARKSSRVASQAKYGGRFKFRRIPQTELEGKLRAH